MSLPPLVIPPGPEASLAALSEVAAQARRRHLEARIRLGQSAGAATGAAPGGSGIGPAADEMAAESRDGSP